jgi:hypothetical protein
MDRGVGDLSEEKLKMFHYQIYMEKKEELQNFLNKEVVLWEGYDNIPYFIKKIIDSQLLALGRYAKRASISEADVP